MARDGSSKKKNPPSQNLTVGSEPRGIEVGPTTVFAVVGKDRYHLNKKKTLSPQGGEEGGDKRKNNRGKQAAGKSSGDIYVEERDRM